MPKAISSRKRKVHRKLRHHPAEFWDSVEFNNNHWIWTGMRSDLHGKATARWYQGRGEGCVSASREAWRRTRGEPPGVIMRLCREKMCVNPAHHDLMDMNIDRYIAKEKGGCWIWLGRLNHGLPVWTDKGGKKDGKVFQRQHTVAKLIWKSIGREIPDGMQLFRKCRVERCVNPEHCKPMTESEAGKMGINSPRWHWGGAHPECHGESNGRSKLNAMQVAKIKVLWKTNSYTQAEIAKRYGVSAGVVFQIVNSKTWKKEGVEISRHNVEV